MNLPNSSGAFSSDWVWSQVKLFKYLLGLLECVELAYSGL